MCELSSFIKVARQEPPPASQLAVVSCRPDECLGGHHNESYGRDAGDPLDPLGHLLQLESAYSIMARLGVYGSTWSTTGELLPLLGLKFWPNALAGRDEGLAWPGGLTAVAFDCV